MVHSFSARVTVIPQVLFRIVGDEAVLLNLKTEMYLGLDRVGTRMWTLLQESSSIEAAYRALLQEYDVDPTQLQENLDEFVGKLLEHGLIELSPATANLLS